MADLKKLKIVRGQCKATLTRIENYIDDPRAAITLDLLEARKEKLHCAFKDYESVQVDILVLDEDDEEDVGSFQDRYFDILAKLNEKIKWGLYMNPVFSETGDFPPIVKERVAAKSAAQGYPRSRLPEFTPEEVEYVRGTADYFGMNHYTSRIVYRRNVTSEYPSPSQEDDKETIEYALEEWEESAADWLRVFPWGFYRLLVYIKDTYNNPAIIITENGLATHEGLEDDDRISYYRGYLGAMLDAIDEGVNVQMYTAWSLMDNFEWIEGYSQRFGLYEVDYESPERTRTPRKSAFVYKHILSTRTLDLNYEPETNVMTIDEGH